MLKLEEVFGFEYSREDLLARIIFEVSLHGNGKVILVEGEADKKIMRIVLERLGMVNPMIVNCEGKDSVIASLKTYTGKANLIGLVDKDLGTEKRESLVITKYMNIEHELIQANDVDVISSKLNLSKSFLEYINVLMNYVYKSLAAKRGFKKPKISHVTMGKKELINAELIHLNEGVIVDWNMDVGEEYMASKQAMSYSHKKVLLNENISYEDYLCSLAKASSNKDEIIALGTKVLNEFKS